MSLARGDNMPFNKGDFTQQGIAGDVTSLVRLNEKRTVKLTLSADDASDNCDISGSVIDELNDKTYPIGSGVSGNIEITENGENINVAPYATATVNVSGGGDVPYCILEIENTATAPGTYYIDSNAIDGTNFWCYMPMEGFYSPDVQNVEFAEQETKAIYSIPLPIMLVPDDFTSIISSIAIVILDSNITITDLVNCTVVTNETGRFLQITVPTEYAHAKISLDLGAYGNG